jgi:hypothetical protein
MAPAGMRAVQSAVSLWLAVKAFWLILISATSALS